MKQIEIKDERAKRLCNASDWWRKTMPMDKKINKDRSKGSDDVRKIR